LINRGCCFLTFRYCVFWWQSL